MVSKPKILHEPWPVQGVDHPAPEANAWQGELRVDDGTFVRVLAEAVRALDDGSVPYVLMGGIGSAAHGRPRWTHDIDFYVRPDDARKALDALAARGFATQETDQHWLYKGLKDNVLVDIIFRSKGDVYLDDDMLSHAEERTFKGVCIRTISPEDLLIIKAIVHEENIPHHWHDALSIISGAADSIDWEYLVRRAKQHGTKRVLSVLLYAQSNDLMVPNAVIRELFAVAFE